MLIGSPICISAWPSHDFPSFPLSSLPHPLSLSLSVPPSPRAVTSMVFYSLSLSTPNMNGDSYLNYFNSALTRL